ncbi:MAG: RNA polymerase sigma-I factor [Actinobacteria bacterium]|nr:RNA polymerase sigma-I factor [Actinomycetota bacterium]
MFFETGSFEEKVIKSKNDNEKISRLISQFKPFIASVIQKKLCRYLEYGVDDELSIGLLAFNEAVNSYDKNKGRFLSFAKLVINNRLIDYYRKNSRNPAVLLSIDEENSEESNGSGVGLLDKKSIQQHVLDSENEAVKLELIEYSQVLRDWGIRFRELIKISPKQESLRKEYIRVARIIADDKKLLEDLTRTKRLPIKELGKITPIHRKKIERGRIYIISIVIAIIKKFSFLDSSILD